MTQRNEFEVWLDKEQPNVYRAAIGLGWWSPEQRNEAAKKMHALCLAWGASRAATLEEAAKLVENEYGFHNIADAVRALKQDREMNDG